MPNRLPLSKQDRQARLIGLFLAAFLLFNFPLLGIFADGEKWGGIPALFLYIGVCWVGLVIGLFGAMRGISGPPAGRNGQDESS